MRTAAWVLSALLFGPLSACSARSPSEVTLVSKTSLTQDWESGVGDWTDSSDEPPTLVTDATSPAGPTVQQIDRATVGGDYRSPLMDVEGGQSYCLRAKIKWVSGAAPFVGVEQHTTGVPSSSPTTGVTNLGVNWLIGSRYTDARGTTTVVSATNTGWQDFQETFVVSQGTTQVRLVDELYQPGSKGGEPLAYFDGLSFESGACAPPTALPYAQDWEIGVGNWKDYSGQAPTLATDATSPTGSRVQALERATPGGDYFSPLLDVTGGLEYCIRSNVKWVSGAAPFIGVEQYANHVSQGINWLMGTQYSDRLGSTTVLSRSDSGWQELARTLTLSFGTTQIRLVDELYQAGSKGGNPLAYVDGISVASGQCTPMPYTQDWEAGVGKWHDVNGQPPTLVSDAAAPAGPMVQQLNRATAGGDYFSPWLEVRPGRTYCVRANLKWVSGAAPFVGVERYANGVSQGVSWLLGTAYSDSRGSTTPISSTETGWQQVGRTLSIPSNVTQIRLVDELYRDSTKGGDPLAYIDGLSLDTGSCSPPYTQDWELGTGGWKDVNGQPPALVKDGSSSFGQMQLLNRSTATATGDYFSPKLEVTGGEAYCIGAYVKWLSGAAPFVGIEQFAGGVSQGITWLIGTEYTDAHGSTAVLNNSTTDWQWRDRTLQVSAGTTQVRLVDMLFESGTKGGDPLANFDAISINLGYCADDAPSASMSTEKSVYVAGEPVIVSWSSPKVIMGRIQLSSGVTADVGPALSGNYTFENLPIGGNIASFLYRSSGGYIQLASTYFTVNAGSTDKTEYPLGTPVVVNWGNLGVPGGRVVIVPSGSSISGAIASMDVDLSKAGNVTFSDLPVGEYQVIFVDGSSNYVGAAPANISVFARFAASRPDIVPYDFIVATWRDCPQNAQNWVAIAPEGSSDATVIDWVYTVGANGSHAFGPLATGTYRARYFEAGTNAKLYESDAIRVKTLTPVSFAQVDSDESITCGVTPEHKVKCWGVNWCGQLGDGTTTDSFNPVEVIGVSTATAVSAGAEHGCAVTSDGGVHCWGANWYGQLGDGTNTDSLLPVTVAGITTAIAVNTGRGHTCAMTSDGRVLCWGANWYGQLGNNTYNDSTSPVEVSGMSTANAITSGATHSCAVTTVGQVRCWGDNSYDQLSDGSGSSSATPVEVSGVSTATAIAAGDTHTCAVTSNGKVYCWGEYAYGNLGDGGHSNTAVEVAGISNAVGVSSGTYSSCALLSDGTARCWGDNSYGQLGNGQASYSQATSPVEVIGISNPLSLSVGTFHGCALFVDGSLKCWGGTPSGWLTMGGQCSSTDAVVVTNINSIAVGSEHVCASSMDGHARCWGYNYSGQLGNGAALYSNNWAATPVDVAGLTAVAAMSARPNGTCALSTDGKVYCWGANWSGQLGDGTQSDSAVPVQVVGISTATELSGGYDHTCARLSDQQVRCWGANSYGQLGDGTQTDSTTPVVVAGMSTATAISIGTQLSCAVTDSGQVSCWGLNSRGQLGNGTTTDSPSPAEVLGISTAIAIGVGYEHACAVTSEGKVQCWGANLYGQLGNQTNTDSASPVEVIGITNAIAVNPGSYHSCARLNDGRVMCWGANWYGQLGDGSYTDRNLPIEMGGVDNAIAVSAGYQDTCVWHSGDKLRCWGDSSYGQFGDGMHPFLLTPQTVMSLQ